MITIGLEPLDRYAKGKLLDVVVAVIVAAPVIFIMYVILAGEEGAPAPQQAGQAALGQTGTPSATAEPAPGTTTVQRVRGPGPDRTVLMYQTSVAPGIARVVRETISETEPGVISRTTTTLPGRIFTATVTADAPAVVQPGPTSTVTVIETRTVTETAAAATVVVPEPDATVTVTEPPSEG